ncbi:MAG: hypothetical protein KF774_19900 [Planctomyces sp.]|nr:hypothetical protein [Planctomyces sp.]
MAERKYTHGLSTRQEHGVTVVSIGDMEIWDGADLSLLRDTLTQLIQRDRCRSIAIDMSTVQFVPSGFFGMLFDWFEQGVSVRLMSPRGRVRNMLWFKRFFVGDRAESYRLRDAAPVLETDDVEWSHTSIRPGAQDSDPGLAIARAL